MRVDVAFMGFATLRVLPRTWRDGFKGKKVKNGSTHHKGGLSPGHTRDVPNPSGPQDVDTTGSGRWDPRDVPRKCPLQTPKNPLKKP